MIGLPNCKEITRLVLEGEERPLGRAEKLVVRAHYLICRGCTNFGKQVELMRKASARWRNYSED
ncbi:zf-HC2 domain-containing protein [Paucibacter sp. B2R-40]|uniref:anti-sigma factor family protein n=1 Tax=Paucibacter sp. B2R-40 TaxID=2893554 RepID=UPI0021E39F28|nr:zf-HC2 domain-containing protein [Paucibacter sp. B2R-40]MCV2352952.1 zf-HC2 domain-containing protein [Paucibacter sp. B2R-40]